MQHHQSPSEADRPAPTSPGGGAPAAAAQTIQPSSPRLFFSSAAAANPTATSHRRIAIAVDLSDESAHAVKWAVQNYLRPGDAVILLHVRSTSVLYGADWGSIDLSVSETAAATEDVDSEQSQQKLEEDFDAFTITKAQHLAQPLVESHIPFKIHIVKDHDMKERLCLEVERLGLSAVIMGSRGFGASKRSGKGRLGSASDRLGSVSDYCVHHCVCPVVVVRYPDEAAGGLTEDAIASNARTAAVINKDPELHPVPEEEEFHDASEAHKGLFILLFF
ncbi:universal stress protein PHOS32-like [Phalaenopsis equestris]|uniref:universal stress protein PHOS32-like n=1 Tax=Phalaenopsis equestris TaxID=78828 RepID=UPI0009E36EAB|nr:universal stress protein PHOS32-like [Phalaenopsis equestris]